MDLNKINSRIKLTYSYSTVIINLNPGGFRPYQIKITCNLWSFPIWAFHRTKLIRIKVNKIAV